MIRDRGGRAFSTPPPEGEGGDNQSSPGGRGQTAAATGGQPVEDEQRMEAGDKEATLDQLGTDHPNEV